MSSFAPIPTLTTERLLLRPFVEDDLDAYHAMCADPETMRYIGEGKTLDRSEAWRSIAYILGHWQLRGHGSWAVEERATGRLLGRIGMIFPEGWPGLEVGWLLGRPYWGQGFATEGGRAALRFAFDVLDAPHVISVIHPLNKASIRVAEKLGERRERTTMLYGQEVLIYGIDRPASGG